VFSAVAVARGEGGAPKAEGEASGRTLRVCLPDRDEGEAEEASRLKFENRETVSLGHGMFRHGMIEDEEAMVDWWTNASLPAS
jgi:hypothetical protein